MMIHGSWAVTAATIFISLSGLSAQAKFDRVMLTEVSTGNPDGVEITNFASSPVNLDGWRVNWVQGLNVRRTSAPLNVTLSPGEVIVVCEVQGASQISEAPPGTRIIEAFASIPTTSHSVLVYLQDSNQQDIDIFHVADRQGNFAIGVPSFRGLVMRDLLPGPFHTEHFERIWGLDSDAADDWTAQRDRSFGLENRNSGPRSPDTSPEAEIIINEIDPSPAYVELKNASSNAVDLQGFSILYSPRQLAPIRRIEPFPNRLVLPPGGYVVIGSSATPPAELAPAASYVQVSGAAGTLSLATTEFTLGLYDDLGQCLDIVRTAKPGTKFVHNEPRLPCPWEAFVGAASYQARGAGAVGRAATTDSDRGTDWAAVWTRTMGSSNGGFSTTSMSRGDRIDVRVNEGRDNGITVIINGGPGAAGMTQHLFLSLAHSRGTGPFFGLGSDALFNWALTYGLAPFMSTLDAEGSARWDFPPRSIPAGTVSDYIFYIEGPGTLRLTPIVTYDN